MARADLSRDEVLKRLCELIVRWSEIDKPVHVTEEMALSRFFPEWSETIWHFASEAFCVSLHWDERDAGIRNRKPFRVGDLADLVIVRCRRDAEEHSGPCACCGYDLSRLRKDLCSVCPECGRPIPNDA